MSAPYGRTALMNAGRNPAIPDSMVLDVTIGEVRAVVSIAVGEAIATERARIVAAVEALPLPQYDPISKRAVLAIIEPPE